MNCLDDDGTFTNGGGHTFHGARADVAHGEYARKAGHEETGWGGSLCVTTSAGDYKAALIQLEDVFEPVSAGICSDHDEKTAGEVLCHPARAVADAHRSQAVIAAEFDHLGSCLDLDVCGMPQTLNQILRHALR